MAKYTYIILGGGIVAGYAAEEFARQGIEPNQLAIISADDVLPYSRPALSKGYLEGDANTADIRINNQNFYREYGIDVFLKTTVERIDIAQKQLHTNNMQIFPFENLLIATGSQVNTLDIPGADLEGVEYLRWLDDSSKIRNKITGDTCAVILGGGYIGMEVTSVVRQLDVPTTMVFPDKRFMEHRFMTPEMSEFFEDYFKQHGTKIIKGQKPTRIIGSEGRVKGVQLESGEMLDANLIVAGIGVMPNIDPVTSTMIETDEGILTDEYLTTNLPYIYAAGDVAQYYDPEQDSYRRVGHWDNARAQGIYAARRMMGKTDEPFTYTPYFFSDVFDLSYEFWGETDGADEVVYRGEINEDGFSVWWLRNHHLIGAFVMGRSDEERQAAQRLIANRTQITREMIENGDFIPEAQLS